MCAIVGAIIKNIYSRSDLKEINEILAHIWKASHERGRDGRGYYINSFTDMIASESTKFINCSDGSDSAPPQLTEMHMRGTAIIGNLRAEPTTEYVQNKNRDDQQPYFAGRWAIVHNGTIANDKELRTNRVPTKIDSAAIVEQLDLLNNTADRFGTFYNTIKGLKGSYAILANHASEPDTLYVAVNYRPIWYARTEYGIFFASARHYFPEGLVPQMVHPYTVNEFTAYGKHVEFTLYKHKTTDKALVVCSGGLDSVVSATYAQRAMGMDVHLIHFLYGCRAEGHEIDAIKAVANELKCELTLFPLNVYAKGDSPLLDADAQFAGGEEGAEFAHEWVPARNLLLLSVATAFAEARGIETIVLGNNLEEAGAYPDNEPEFIAKFNDLLPFAVGDGKRMRVIMPVGNLMKHEIVALGNEYKAPMHLTWSCYRNGEKHCGKCGPCYMRKTAFRINNLPEVIEYDI